MAQALVLPSTPVGRGRGRKGVVPTLTTACAACGVDVTRKDSDLRRWLRRNPRYWPTCSPRCSNALRALHGGPTVELSCASCGETFTRRRATHDARLRAGICAAQYCSLGCYRAVMASRNQGRPVPTVELRCAECGSIFRRNAAQQRHKDRETPGTPNFCKRACATRSQHLRSAVRRSKLAYWADPDARRRASEQRVAQMAAGISSSSSHEEIVACELAALGVAFERQVSIALGDSSAPFACVDFRLSSGQVLEVFGKFWHCDPRTYPHGPVSAVQRRTIAADHRKAACFRKLGIPVVVLWELDIDANASEAVRSALRQLGIGAT